MPLLVVAIVMASTVWLNLGASSKLLSTGLAKNHRLVPQCYRSFLWYELAFRLLVLSIKINHQLPSESIYKQKATKKPTLPKYEATVFSATSGLFERKPGC